MDIRSRAGWGARAPRSVTRLPTGSLRGVAIHWFYSPRSPATPDGVSAVIRSVQNGHMAPGGLGAKDGGSDIGYSHIVDVWGRIWTGRGWDVRPGATGPANDTHGAIVYAAGSGDPFTAEAKRAINWLIGEYRRRGAGSDVGWHSQFMQTDCPGDVIRAWIAAGRPADPKEDDLPDPKDIWQYEVPGGGGSEPTRAQVHLRYQSNALRALLAHTKKDAADVLDEQAIAQAVLEGLAPETIAAAVAEALPPDLAAKVVDELTERLAS